MHARLQKATGRDTLSWRRRLIATADALGRDKQSGMAMNACLPDGTPVNANRRLWPQLEMFRARLWHPDTAPPGDADQIFARLHDVYFKSMPKGLWLDETDSEGQPVSEAIPASIHYHLVTGLSPALR